MGDFQLLLKAEVGKPVTYLNFLRGTKMRKRNQSPGLEPHFYFVRVGSKNQLSVSAAIQLSLNTVKSVVGNVELQKEAMFWADAAAACAGRHHGLIPVLPQYWKIPARQDWKRHCGSASQMMGLPSVPLPWIILLGVQVLLEEGLKFSFLL